MLLQNTKLINQTINVKERLYSVLVHVANRFDVALQDGKTFPKIIPTIKRKANNQKASC